MVRLQVEKVERLYPVSILPHLVRPVHVDCCSPFVSLDEVVLSLGEPGFTLQLLKEKGLNTQLCE